MLNKAKVVLFLKTILFSVVLCGVHMSAMATDRFIVKYKLNEAQKTFLSTHGGAK